MAALENKRKCFNAGFKQRFKYVDLLFSFCLASHVLNVSGHAGLPGPLQCVKWTHVPGHAGLPGPLQCVRWTQCARPRRPACSLAVCQVDAMRPAMHACLFPCSVSGGRNVPGHVGLHVPGSSGSRSTKVQNFKFVGCETHTMNKCYNDDCLKYKMVPSE